MFERRHTKTVEITVFPDGGANSIVWTPHGIENFGEMVSVSGRLKAASGTWYPIPTPHGTSQNQLQIFVNDTNIGLRSSFDWAGTDGGPQYADVTIVYTVT